LAETGTAHPKSFARTFSFTLCPDLAVTGTAHPKSFTRTFHSFFICPDLTVAGIGYPKPLRGAKKVGQFNSPEWKVKHYPSFVGPNQSGGYCSLPKRGRTVPRVKV